MSDDIFTEDWAVKRREEEARETALWINALERAHAETLFELLRISSIDDLPRNAIIDILYRRYQDR